MSGTGCPLPEQDVLNRVKDKGSELLELLPFLFHTPFGDFFGEFSAPV